MLFLLIALFFSSCIFFTFKYFNKFNISILPAIATNYFLASAFGYFGWVDGISTAMVLQQPWILMAVLTGSTFILTFVVFAVSTQRVGVAMTVVSSKMSIVLSVAAGLILLAEPYNLLKISGIVAALAAFFLTNYGRGEVNVEKKYLYLPVLIFFGTGANDILMKLSGVYFTDRDEIQFLTITFFTAFILALFLLLYRVRSHTIKVKWKDIAAGLLLGIFNWYSTYFFIKGLEILPISLFIPVFNASLVLIASVSGFFLFREKLSPVNRIGILLAVAAIVAIAFS
jgi:drug/metabolite transporter (DMT)-like permease